MKRQINFCILVSLNVSVFVYCKNGDAKGDVHESAGHERGDMKR